MPKDIRIERCSGAELAQYIPELARLRIEVFRDFPYLYDGNYDYEEKYLQTYIDTPDSVIVLAFDGDKVVGASTALPMRYETDELKKPFLYTTIRFLLYKTTFKDFSRILPVIPTIGKKILYCCVTYIIPP